ncbi:MAG: helix-turn-helix transcriptional regulator [Anaerolineaceae bacterium]|nr:helix-turn-helix transcriptional regulator [Anaerolineaceae bacterium]
MARASVKENKTIYQLKREELGLSREKAAELLQYITPERIERIESGKSNVHPDEVMLMAEKYQSPHLCNYYCANECEIGRHYVPEIKTKELSQIVLEMLASLNSMQRKQERLIEITSDGVIEEAEFQDFLTIQKELEKISITVETLQLWAEKNIDHYKELNHLL